jgi:O-antigen biosynthesis protein
MTTIHVELPAVGVLQPAELPVRQRVSVSGKFLWHGSEKFFIKGVSYGTFVPNINGEPFPEPARAAHDLALMRAAGFNTLRTYDPPPSWLLDLAQQHGVLVLAGLPWPQHVTVADSRIGRHQLMQSVAADVRACAQHPAILAYCVGNEIPTQVVRWYGKRRTEQLIQDLCSVARDADPGGLVTYANYPPTEYLELPFLDFHCFNVYLHAERDFQAYLARLQVLAGHQPICLSEYGLDALQHGEAAQAGLLEQQALAAFRAGFCGTVAFAWTDEWYRGGQNVTGWQFGLTDVERNPKPSYHRLAELLPSLPFGATAWPRISVVVAAYNAGATLDDCLSALSQSHYPGFEVIVVDDGSTDSTAEIADAHARCDSRFRVLHGPNHGLSVARNTGLAAASGDIVAYTDADCRADGDWLHYIALKLLNSDVMAVGGPNLVPDDDGPIAQAVGFSPGNPTHIMLSDEIAEHIPGCNMAFWKWVLDDVGGFQPIYTSAGDDVDICWRLQARGYRIGFAPAALVWHHRRNSMRAYLRQQIGYGHAESLLEREHPEKFNGLGQVRWAGRIYAGSTALKFWHRPRIYQGVFGSAAFQSLYQPADGLFAYLPQTPEWYALLVGLLVFGAFNPLLTGLALAGVGWQVALCAYASRQAQLPSRHPRRMRWLIFWMHLLQPLARSWGRVQGGLGPFRWTREERRPTPTLANSTRTGRAALRRLEYACWGENDQDKDTFLRALMKHLFSKRCVLNTNSGWEGWDLRIERGLSAHADLLIATEYHGGPKVLMRGKVSFSLSPAGASVMFLLLLAGLYLYLADFQTATVDWWLAWLGIAIPLAGLLWLLGERAQLAIRIDEAVQRTADQLNMKIIDPKQARL